MKRIGLILIILAGLGAAGGGYWWVKLKTSQAVALCEAVVRPTLAVAASYQRTAAETMPVRDGEIVVVHFDAVTRGGLPRSMAAECWMSSEHDLVWRLPASMRLTVNGETIDEDFVRPYARTWAREHDGDNIPAEIAYQRAMQLSEEVLKPKKP